MDENAVPGGVAEAFAVVVDGLVKSGRIRENEFGLEAKMRKHGDHKDSAGGGIAVTVTERLLCIADVFVGEIIKIWACDADALHHFVANIANRFKIVVSAKRFREFLDFRACHRMAFQLREYFNGVLFPVAEADDDARREHRE